MERHRVLLTFTLPPGVTEAHVRWRRDRYPTGPTDPQATGGTVTNTKLEIAGGYVIDNEDDHLLHVVVYPAIRLKGMARAVAAQIGSAIVVPGFAVDTPG